MTDTSKTTLELIEEISLLRQRIQELEKLKSIRKRAKDELPENEHTIRALFDRTFEFIGMLTPNGTLIEANRTVMQFLGINESDCLGKPFWDTPWWAHSAEMQSNLHEAVTKALRGEIVQLEVTCPAADGSIHYVECSLKPVRDELGKITFLIAEGRDITERKQMEEELREKEVRYRAFFRTSRDCVFITSVDGQWLDLNDAAVQLFGYDSKEELLNVQIKDLYAYPDDRMRHLEIINEKAYSPEVPISLRKKDGTVIDTLITSVLLRDSAEMVIGYQGTIRDITERVRGENALRESQQMLQSVLDTIPARVFWKDLDLNYLGCNRWFAVDAGLQSPDEISGRNDFELPWAEQAELYRADDRLVLETGKPKLAYEEHQTTPKGERIRLRTSKAPLFGVKGEIKGVLGTYEDITVEKLAQEALQESEIKYRSLAESIPGAVYQFVLHKDGSFSFPYLSKRITQYLGISPEAAMADSSLPFAQIHPDDREMMNRAISISARTLKNISVEHRLTDAAGQLRWFRAEATPQRLSNGDILWHGVTLDITERKQAEEALRESRAHLAVTIESIPFEFWVIGADGRYTMQNHICRERYGDIIGKRPEQVCPTESLFSVWRDCNRRAFDGELVQGEVRYVFKNEERYFRNIVAPIKVQGRVGGIVGMNVDITDRKFLEAALKKANGELESQVEERTKELGAKTRNLEELNAALKVLLKQREEDRLELEENILQNVKSLIVPNIEKLGRSRLNDDQTASLAILESHLRELTSPFTRRLSEKYIGLTPLEVQTAGLIKAGKTSKEIAESLGVSVNTVSVHRFHIRRKLGLGNRKVNLRYYLQYIAQQ